MNGSSTVSEALEWCERMMSAVRQDREAVAEAVEDYLLDWSDWPDGVIMFRPDGPRIRVNLNHSVSVRVVNWRKEGF